MTPFFLSHLVASCPWKTGVRDRDYAIDRGSMTCFRVVTSQKKQWWSARDACTSSGDMLAVLEPLEKAKFIDEFMNTNYGMGGFQIVQARFSVENKRKDRLTQMCIGTSVNKLGKSTGQSL